MDLEAFTRHLANQDRSDGTIAAYAGDLEAFCAWYRACNHEPMEPERVMSVDVREFKEHLIDESYSAATVNRRLAALSTFFGWCVETGIVESDPTSSIHGVRRQRNAPRWLTRNERRNLVRELHAACQLARTPAARFRAYRDRAMVALMMWCGLRRSEVADAELAKLTMNGRSGQLEVLGKGQKVRIVHLNVDAYKAVKAWLELRGDNPSRYLFLSQQGAGMTGKSVYRAVTKYAQKAAIDGMTPHSLRHTFGKSLVDADVSLEKIARLMGHDDLDTTAIYLEPSEQDLADAVDRIAWTE